MRLHTCLLWAVLLIGLFLRIYGLCSESLWFDETYVIGAAHNKSPDQIIHELQTADLNPPLFYIFMGYWMQFTGTSAFAMRFPSAIFAVLSIFMIYKIGTLLFDKQTSIISSALLSLSVYHLYYSQEAKMYALMTFLTISSFYFLIKLLEKPSEYNAFFYVITSSLLTYTHVYAFFAIASQNLYVLTNCCLQKNHRILKKWIFLQCILVLLFLPWLPTMIKQIENGQLSWVPQSTAATLTESFLKYANMDLAIYPLLIIAAYSIVLLAIRKTERQKVRLLLIWLLTPIVLPIIISQFMPIFSFIFIIGALPAFYLFAGEGIRNIKNNHFKSIIILLIVLLSATSIYQYNVNDIKEQWQEVAADIDAQAKNTDLLLFTPGSQGRYSFPYYSKRTDLTIKSFPLEVTHFVNDDNINELLPLVEDYDRIWFILSLSKDPHGLVAKTLGERYNLSYHNKYTKISVYLFEKK